MNEDFMRFRLEKNKMNQVRGGGESITYICTCYSSGGQLAFAVSAESNEILSAKMNTECKGSGWGCRSIG